MLIVFDENVYMIEENKEDEFIKNELYKSWSFFAYFMYSLSYYDLEYNEYFYLNASKVKYIFRIGKFHIYLIYFKDIIMLTTLFYASLILLKYTIWFGNFLSNLSNEFNEKCQFNQKVLSSKRK